MRGQLRVLFCVVLVLGAASSSWAKQVVGWVENVKLYPGGVTVRAKLDTGARTSSLDCECITPFMRDGKQWLSFSIKNHQGDVVRLEKPVVRIARIKSHLGKSQRRYVVKLGICLATVYREAEVTLANRSGFNYAFLVGRNFLKNNFLIDPSLSFSHKPRCKGAPE